MINDFNAQWKIHRYAEYAILPFVRGLNPSDVARKHNYLLKCPVYDDSGNELELHLNKICNETAFKNWQRAREKEGNPVDLSTLPYTLLMNTREWSQYVLDGKYSRRYAYARTRKARQFVRRSCYLFLVNAHAKEMYQSKSFLDPWVANEVDKIFSAREFAQKVHEATGHALKHNENLAEAQAETFHQIMTIFDGRPAIPFTPPPSLPEGMSDPIILVEDEEGEDDE